MPISCIVDYRVESTGTDSNSNEQQERIYTVTIPSRKQVIASDSKKHESKMSVTLMKVNSMIHNLNWTFSNLAFENALAVYALAANAKLRPLVVDNLQNDEGVFIDFAIGETYYAFEFYNDGEIIRTQKVGDQNSTVQSFSAADQINFV